MTYTLLAIGSMVLGAGGFGEPQPSSCGFESSNVTLLGWVELDEFPGDQTRGSDIWGYVSPSGREYAIMGLRHGTAFIEVTEPANPQVVGYVQGPTSIWRDMRTLGHYCYIVSQNGDGLQIVDLQNIDNGLVTLATTSNLNGFFFGAHNISLNPASGYAYLVLADVERGLTALDLTDPLDPQIVGMWSEHDLHDVQVVTYTEGVYAGREIAYGFAEEGGLRIIDVTDKSNMFTLSELLYPNATYCHQGWFSEDLQYLYVSDELDERNNPNVSTTTTYVFDISDLENPTLQTTFTTGLPSVDHNLMVRGSTLFEANYSSGLRIFDISDVDNIVETAWFDTYPENDQNSFNGAWGVHAQLPSGLVLVSDRERGLMVFDTLCDQRFRPRIAHFETGVPRVASGYIDPRIESTDGLMTNQGLFQITFVFTEQVRAIGGGALSTDAFEVRQTGEGSPPEVLGIIENRITDKCKHVVTILLSRSISPGMWTTFIAHVEDMCGLTIESNGDQGPGIDEPDRIDIGFLPGDVNRDSQVSPEDVLHFRQFTLGLVEDDGGALNIFDLNRDGRIGPFDVLTIRRIIAGVTPATQPWAGLTLDQPRP